MKKITALFLALAMVLTLVACSNDKSSGSESPDPNAGVETTDPNTEPNNDANPGTEDNNTSDPEDLTAGTFDMLTLEADASRTSTANSDGKYAKIVVPNDEIADLNPYNNLSGGNASISVEIYETLFDYVGGELVNHLATGYTQIDDTHVQVTIYDYIYDWEGNNITADDVVFSYELTANSGYASDFNYYESVKAIDPYTVEFTWNAPIASLTAFPKMMSNVCIVSEKAYGEHNFTTDPIGTGIYKLDSFTVGVSLVLKANDDEYWQTDKSLRSPYAVSNVEEIEFDVLTDATMQTVALEGGKIDYCSISSQNIENYIESGKYRISTVSNPFLTGLLLNQSSDSLCQDENLRLAIYYAIDNSAIAEAIGSYSYYPATCLAAPSYGDYQASWDTAENYNTVYDPALAKEYLAKSNYNGETLELMGNNLDANQTAIVIIQNFLLEVGINTHITVLEATATNSITSQTDGWDILISAGRSSSGLCISRIASDFLASSNPNGIVATFGDDPALTEMVEKCNTNDGYSVELTNEIMQYLIDHVYAYGMFGNTLVYAFNPAFASFTLYNSNTSLVIGACDYYLD